MKFGLRPGVGPLAWLIAVASLVLGCAEDQKHNPVHDGGMPDQGTSTLVLDAGSSADASDFQIGLDASPGDGGALAVDASNSQDRSYSAPGDDGAIAVDASNPQDQSDDAVRHSDAIVSDASGLPDIVDGGSVIDGVAEESWTIAILPDTQNSYFSSPSFFDAETRWIAENHVQQGIAFVLHEGDIVQYPWVEGEWAAARATMGLLDGKVPYVLAVGNHDLGSTRTDAGVLIPRSTPINNYFSYDEIARAPTFGGAFENGHIENTYHLLTGGGRTWLVISLEFSPRNEVVAWADQVLTAHANLPAILLTHAYLYSDGQRYDLTGRACQFTGDCTSLQPPGANPQCWNPSCYIEGLHGEMLWSSLVKGHSNLLFVFSGHVANAAPFDAARLSSTRADGTVCHQIMADYQAFPPSGGEGYFRLLRIWRDGRVQVRTFSPYVDPDHAHLTEDRNQFDLHIDLPG